MGKVLGNWARRHLLAAVLIAVGSCWVLTTRASAQSETAGVCFCDARGGIGISQLVGAVNVALGRAACPGSPGEANLQGTSAVEGVCFCDTNGSIAISQLVRAVNVALGNAACPDVVVPETPTATGTQSDTAAPTITSTPTATATPTSTPLGLMDLGLTVVDLDAGLEWVKADDGDGLTDKDNEYSWSATGEDRDGTVFTEYLAGLNGATYAGHRDWRLPSSGGSEGFPSGERAELESLLDCGFSPCIDPLFGPATSEAYWSDSSFASSPTSAWIGVVDSGAVVADGKINEYGARAVRDFGRDCEGKADGTTCDARMDGVVLTCESEACVPCVRAVSDPRLVDNGDGTVTDRKTCLVWEQKTGEGGGSIVCSDRGVCPDPHHVQNTYSWSSGGPDHLFDGGAKRLFLDRLNDEAGNGATCFADHCDWRLPSSGGRPDLEVPSGEAAEIESILTCSSQRILTCLPPNDGRGCDGAPPHIDPIFGPTASRGQDPPGNSGASLYWSSTPRGDPSPDGAWLVDFENGLVFSVNKRDDLRVRAVRGGPGACE